MSITTTVTWADLIDAQNTELDDLRDAYEEVAQLAREKYGDDALQRPVPSDPGDEEMQRLAVLQQQAAMYDRAGKQYQQRIHLLEQLRDELGTDPFRVKMLSGAEVLDTEAQLRADVDGEDDEGSIQARRNQRTVNAAVVDAPGGVPTETVTDEDGEEYETPKPSEAPNALVDSLFDAVQKFNSAGDPDFRAAGFGGPGPASAASGSSATPPDSGTPSKPSAPQRDPETGPDESESA